MKRLILLPLLAVFTLTACQPPAAQRRDLEAVEKTLAKLEAQLDRVEKTLLEQKAAPAAPATPEVAPAREITVYVVGSVKNSGRFQLPEGTTAFAAIAAAGGLNEFARPQITITRSGEADIPLTLLEQKDFVLQTGDVITTTQTVF